MKIRALKYKDRDFAREWPERVENRWVYDDFRRSPDWRQDWISFDCLLYHPADDRVYCGITSFDNDIFRAYNRHTGEFQDLGFSAIADPYDAKFHRSLLLGRDGCIYGAVALLHCIDHYYDAPGGAIVVYHPGSGSIAKLGIPLPHVYIQSLIINESSGMAYALGFHPQCLLEYNLQTRQGRMLAPITSGYGGGVMSENIIFDAQGCVWSNWGLTRAWSYSVGPDAVRLCKYDPRQDRMQFYQHGLPTDKPGEYAAVEAFFNFGDGFLYASGNNGSLYRLDPESAAAELLCRPVSTRRSRLTSLVKVSDNTCLGIVGRDGQCELCEMNFRTGRYFLLGPVRDAAGVSLWQCHDLALTPDGVLYAGENDNPSRSSYLWEIRL